MKQVMFHRHKKVLSIHLLNKFAYNSRKIFAKNAINMHNKNRVTFYLFLFSGPFFWSYFDIKTHPLNKV